ncbi:MAG: Rieske 2Fe-2S domain-containing protein [Acidimicrobiales bacterium]|jgi:cytochrome b6-f complex iron-sulfur subunit|nr:Rieske 2Fe-2S domain-containing protein [Acidimicrobiales bacterium]
MTPLYADINPLVVAIPVVVVLALVVLVASATRRDKNAATGQLLREARRKDAGTPEVLTGPERPGGPGAELETVAVPTAEVAPYVPPDPETIGVTRRQFLNRSIVAFFGLGLAGFGAAVLGFLWPQPKGGFGSKINVGPVDEVKAKVQAGSGFYYLAEGRMWVTEFPAGAVEKAKLVYSEQELGAMEAGLVALYQKCPHLGCRVPDCKTSQWFECPCHGSQYNQVGEKKGGPAPRGMDRFAQGVEGGTFVVNTGQVIQGPPIGTNTTGQEAEGPHCVGAGGGH